MRLAAGDDKDEEPFVALVNKLFSMSAAFGATLTLACRSRLDCDDDDDEPPLLFRLELSRFLELLLLDSFGMDFSIDVSDPPDIEPYIGPKSELRLDDVDMYCDSMLELAFA